MPSTRVCKLLRWPGNSRSLRPAVARAVAVRRRSLSEHQELEGGTGMQGFVYTSLGCVYTDIKM